MAIIKQYVNLPSGVTTNEGLWRDVRVPPNADVAAGDRTDWWVEPDPGNTDITYINPTKRANMTNAERAIAASGFFENRVNFPHVGGDKYIVKAAKKVRPVPAGRPSQQTDTFETWRKLYYTVWYMGANDLAMFNSLEPRFKAAFAAGYVELENTVKQTTISQIPRADCNPDFRFMAGTTTSLMDLRHGNTGPQGTGTLTHKPFNVALLVVPDCYYTESQTVLVSSTRAVVGSTQVRYELQINPGPWITRAVVRWTGQANMNVIPRMNVVSSGRWVSEVGWDLNAVVGLTNHLAGGAARNFTLEFDLVQEHGLMGYSLANFCVVRTRDGITDVLQTFTHEVGHGIKQATEVENKWTAAGVAMAAERNPKWHTDVNGGQGPHCSTNAVLVNASADQIAASRVGLTMIYAYGGAGRLCTMFFSGEPNVDPDGKFCVGHCEPRIKRKDLDSTAMTSQPQAWRRWNYVG
jgi:hypothetical protein